MGIQAQERRDELEELRRANRRLLEAAVGAVCGDASDRHIAERILADMASDPRIAQRMLAMLEGSEAAPKDGSDVVVDAVHTTLGVAA